MKPTMAEFFKKGKTKSLHRINNNTDIAGKMTNELDDSRKNYPKSNMHTHKKGL